MAILSLSTSSYAQPEIDLSRLYDNGDEHDCFYDVYHCRDGDFLLCGGSGQSNWVMRLDPEGNPRWDYIAAHGSLHSIIEADNGDAVATGSVEGFGALRLDPDGRVVWRRAHTTGIGSAIIELKEGDFVIIGNELHDHNFNESIISRINGNGEVVWSRRFGDENASISLYSMRETDGNLIMAGATMTDSSSLGFVQKTTLNGEVVWSRTYSYRDAPMGFRSIVSIPQNGFAVGGSISSPGSQEWVVYEIDEDGEPFQISNIDIPRSSHLFQCIDKLSDGGIIAVGTIWSVESGNFPYAARLDFNGNVRWTTDLHDLVTGANGGPPAKALLHSVICLPEDVIVAAGDNLNGRNWSRTDGWLVRFGSDQLRPSIFYRQPEDSLQDLLLHDSIRFVVKARDRMDREITYHWSVNEHILDRGGVNPINDTTVTLQFDELGRIPVTCTVANVDWQVLTGWMISARSLFIYSHSPDTLNLSLRRGTSQDFSLDSVAAVFPQDEIQYQWTLTDLDNFDSWESGAEAGATIEFLRSGNFRLEGLAFAGEGDSLASDNVIWTIQVRSAIFDFLPHSLNLSIPRDTVVTFELIPFNPASDSLRHQWLLDGEVWDVDSLAVRIPFPQEGAHTVMGILMDGMDGDTITWRINVQAAEGVNECGWRIADCGIGGIAPNPFNSSTVIRFSVDKPASTDLAVYDLSGRMVRSLVSGRVEAGEHSVVFDGEGLAAGIYLIRLEAGGNIAVRKALFLR